MSDYTDDVANPISLLYQSGYLTIKKVEEGFLGSLMPTYELLSQEELKTRTYPAE